MQAHAQRRVPRMLAASALAVALVGSLGAPVASGATATSGTLVLTQSTTLKADHFGNILLQTPDVTLDCAGHVVYGPGDLGYSGGIDIAFADRVQVKNCTVTGFVHNGLFAHHSDGLRIEKNTFVANGNHGAHLDALTAASVTGNTARANSVISPASGFIVTRSSGLTIEGNVAAGHPGGGFVLAQGTTGTMVANNTASENGAGFVVESSDGNSLTGNSANRNTSNGFTVLDSVGTILTGNTANLNEWIGFQFDWASSASEVTGNTANGNNDGFNLHGCNANTLTGNTANANRNYGFVVWFGSSYNTLTYNTGLNNGFVDAWEEGTGTGDVWNANTFRTTFQG